MPTTRALRWLLPALLLAEALATVGDLLLGPWARTHWEELFNARGGVQFACGHLDRAWAMQYRTFCGGCTGEGVLAAGLFAAVPPTVLAWKLIPSGIHLGITGLGTWAAWRASGRWAGALFAGLMMAAPGYYRDLALTGWGNHAESTLFPLLALLLVVAGRGALRGAIGLLAAGAVTGLGLWFCYTSGHALPALLAAAWLTRRWLTPLALLAIPLGLLPWWGFHRDRPLARGFAADWVPALDLAPPDAMARWLFGDYLRTGLWSEVDYGALSVLPTVWWAALWVMAALGLAALRHPREPAARAAAWFGPLGLVGLLLAYEIRYDLWSNLPDPYADPSFNLRYRTPLVPMLLLCAALPGARMKRPLRWVLAALIAVGLVLRVSTWDEPRRSVVGLHVYGHDGWPDRTVPVGDPPKKLRRNQGRPQDIAAAMEFLGSHSDPLPDCRLDHVFELGRRLGLGIRGDIAKDRDTMIPGFAARAWLQTDGELERRLLADGVAKGIIMPNTERARDLRPVLDALAGVAPGMGQAVGNAAGRLVAPDFKAPGDEEHRQEVADAVWWGICERRGILRVDFRTQGGRHWPDDGADTTWLEGEAGACHSTRPYWQGVGFGWSRYVGCGKSAESLLMEESAPATEDSVEQARQGWRLGCLWARGAEE